ncbi:MAG: hypothetical protein AAB013_05870 [Planctomycetota bacterium]
MQVNGHILKILPISILSLSVLSCGGNRVNIEFKTPREIYVDDSKTEPDKLNKELEYDLRESEKKRRQKERESEIAAKSKTKAEQKAGAEQKSSEQTTEGEISKPENAKQSSMPK